MTRPLLAAAAVLSVALAAPALAGGPALEDDEKHICVLLDSENNTGYCIKTWGVHVPQVPRLPQAPDLP